MLWLYKRVVFGEITNPEVNHMVDASPREWLYFIPLVVGVIWLGVHPTSITASISPSVKQLLVQVALPDGVRPVVAKTEEQKPTPEVKKLKQSSVINEKLAEEGIPAELPATAAKTKAVAKKAKSESADIAAPKPTKKPKPPGDSSSDESSGSHSHEYPQ
jgi:hypothetical protein